MSPKQMPTRGKSRSRPTGLRDELAHVVSQVDAYYRILNLDPSWTPGQDRPRFSEALPGLFSREERITWQRGNRSRLLKGPQRRFRRFAEQWSLPSSDGVSDLAASWLRWDWLGREDAVLIFGGRSMSVGPRASSYMPWEWITSPPVIAPPVPLPFPYDPTLGEMVWTDLGGGQEAGLMPVKWLNRYLDEQAATLRESVLAQASEIEEQLQTHHARLGRTPDYAGAATRLYRRMVCGMTYTQIARQELGPDPDPGHVADRGEVIGRAVRRLSSEMGVPRRQVRRQRTQ